MYQDLLTQAGLNENEAIIYESLLKHGESAAQDITKNTPLKKGVVYITLDDLIKKGLIKKKMLKPKNPNVRNKSKIAYFTPNHPEKIREFIEKQQTSIITAKNNLEANINNLISDFNLVSGQPGIQVFEGEAGIKKILADSLTAQEEIRTYADMEAIVNHMNEINDEYVKQRDKLGIHKRVIILDSQFGRDYMKKYHRNVTNIKFMTRDKYPFKSVMQIYDNKISYINFTPNSQISVLINDPEIYQLNCAVFEHAWKSAKDFSEL